VQAALDAINAAGLLGVNMRFFAAQDKPAAEVCEQAVRACNAYVAIIGFRYGSLVPDRDMSYTELEFNTATENRIPRIVVLLRHVPSGKSLEDQDRSRIDRFRRRLLEGSGLVVAFAENPDQVQYEVFHALTQARPISIPAGDLDSVHNGIVGGQQYGDIVQARDVIGGISWRTWRQTEGDSATGRAD
jgi:hypothetical protein